MAKITQYVDSLFDSANTVANVMNDYTTNEARRSTQIKQNQLKADIQDQMMQIQRSSTSDQWEQKINEYFDRVKSNMGNKNSVYYCKNNMQADMFNAILNEAQVDVAGKVGQLVFNADREHALVEYQNTLEVLAQTETPENFLIKGRQAAKNLNDCGYIDEGQLQAQYDTIYDKCYINTAQKYFDGTVTEAIRRGDSEQTVIDMVFKNMPELTATDSAGLPKMRDTTQLKDTLTKTMKQEYRAKLSDIQQGNANTLSQIVQEMRQQNTAEGKLIVAMRGQNTMNKMQGLQLNENDRLQYSAIFELALGGDNLKGSGSGSGNKAPTDTFESLIKASPDTALQLWLDGKNGNVYDVTQTVSNALTEQWFTKSFKENYDKDTAEREETFAMQYQGRVSSDTLTDAVTKKVLEKFPTAKNYMDNNFKNLITDMQKNPKEYGSATAGELANFMLDTLYSADSNYTDEDFMTAFKQHVNDCYVERVKYVELDKKGSLEKKFNASKEGDIAKAARLASEKDYVYTFNGNEVWAPGKKEALEAEGGIVDVLKTAVAGTLDIPAEDRGKVGFQYVQTTDDMTSQPIITYKNQAYEVIPNDDNKGFKLREVHTGEIIDGKLAGNKKTERDEAKAEAKTASQNAHSTTVAVEEKRINDTNTKITESKELPKAMAGAGGVKAVEWETGDQTSRQVYLQDTESKINKDAKQVRKNKMTEDDFFKKYGIRYSEWNKTSEKTARFNLILNS